jgi:HlyD family secretion protein
MALSRKRKIIFAAVAVAVLVVIVIVSVFANSKDEPEVTTIKIASRPELRQTVTASGEVRPIRYIRLTSEVAGRILEIYVNPGDLVSPGKPLVRVDPNQLQSSRDAAMAGSQAAVNDLQNARTQVLAAQNGVSQAQQALTVAESSTSQARQQVISSQTAVDRAQVDLNTAERELKRTTQLIESGVSSRFDYDAAKDRYDQARVALKTAQANLKAQEIAVEEAVGRANQQRVVVKDAQRGVDTARAGVRSSESRASQQAALLRGQSDLRDKATQYSPIPGIIADVPTRVGEYAVAGLSTTPLMTIADMSSINVEVNVDETEIANVELGQPAKIKVDALGEKEMEGKVKEKDPLAISKSDTTGAGLSNRVNVQEAKEFKVVIELQNIPDDIRNNLRPGMSSTATITTKVKNSVIAVPLQSIVEKSPNANPSPTVQGAVATPSPVEKKQDLKGVYIVETNKVKFVSVTTGITGEADIEITSGVQPDMEVITGPSRVLKTLKEGQTIKRQTKKPGESGANSNSSGSK